MLIKTAYLLAPVWVMDVSGVKEQGAPLFEGIG